MNKVKESKPIQENSTIGPTGICIQGYEGSFHQVAARHFFGKNVEVITCASFRQLIKLTLDSTVSAGAVMAIENSIVGSILPNYNLVQKANLKVVGEVYLSISQNLLANKGVGLSEIKEVHSHPMAILQCLDFLESHPYKLIETEDTALSAKYVHQHKSKHIAAIASKLAAELFNLEILAPDIQTQKNNITRFLVLQRAKEANPIVGANKASIYFQTNHSKGNLAKVLTEVAKTGLNLSKLQSMPIPGSHFKYGFYADMEFDQLKQFENMMRKIESLTNNVKLFGVYKKGKLVKG